MICPRCNDSGRIFYCHPDERTHCQGIADHFGIPIVENDLLRAGEFVPMSCDCPKRAYVPETGRFRRRNA